MTRPLSVTRVLSFSLLLLLFIHPWYPRDMWRGSFRLVRRPCEGGPANNSSPSSHWPAELRADRCSTGSPESPSEEWSRRGFCHQPCPNCKAKHPRAQSGAYSVAMAWLGSFDHRLSYSNTLRTGLLKHTVGAVKIADQGRSIQ